MVTANTARKRKLDSSNVPALEVFKTHKAPSRMSAPPTTLKTPMVPSGSTEGLELGLATPESEFYTSSDEEIEETEHEDYNVDGPAVAEVPFTIIYQAVDGNKRLGLIEPCEEVPNLNVQYEIEPEHDWTAMRSYGNFQVGREKFKKGDQVFVNPPGGSSNANFTITQVWTAKVLEIRATDERHVYIRINWFYSPDEIPGGRQCYHGRNELLISNHMDVIDGMTVIGRANVVQWDEESDDDSVGLNLYWRQSYNTLSQKVSKPSLHCICQTPHNPDQLLIACSNAQCGIWMHAHCLEYDTLRRTFERQISEDPAAQRRLSHYIKANTKQRKRGPQPQIPWGETLEATILSEGHSTKAIVTNINGPGKTSEEVVYCLKCRSMIE